MSAPTPRDPAPEMRHVVMFSGGVGSFSAAERVVREHGRGVTLVFADTLIEDADLYRFLIEAAAYLTGKAGLVEVSGLAARAANTPPSSDMMRRRTHLSELRADTRTVIPGLVWLADGRTPFEVFHDARFLGNSRVGKCSAALKQRVADRWLDANCDKLWTRVYVGIDWSEEHRFDRLREIRGKKGWHYRAPLCQPPEYDKTAGFERLDAIGIAVPRLYTLGFSHNNCGGGCVRAGIGHFVHLFQTLPEVFAEWERNEEGLRAVIGNHAMLKDRRGGVQKPLPLVQLRRRITGEDSGPIFEDPMDKYDIGGCGCFVDTEDAA